jgi:integrase
MRILTREEIPRLLDASDGDLRVVLGTAIFTGLRQGELLALRWMDVDFDEGVVRVTRALGRDGAFTPGKTEWARRAVVLMPSLARTLKEHRLASRHSLDTDLVFASATGRPLDPRNLGGKAPTEKTKGRGMAAALVRAGIVGEGNLKVRFHDLRHTFASLLVAQGADVVFVSRQLGHASPATTLGIYAHLFDAARHADNTRLALERSFGAML